MTASTTLGQLKKGLLDLGYTKELLQENYKFADYLGSEYKVKTIPLAAFAEEPLSYHTVCFGVVEANGQSGPPLIASHRSLGAPQIFEATHSTVRRWAITRSSSPTFIEEIPTEHIPGLFFSHRNDWTPQRISEARFSSPSNAATQLDFFDFGLLPLLDYEVRGKLNGLLNQTIELAIQQYTGGTKLSDKDYPLLIRLMFRLIAAKLLADREFPGNWVSSDVGQVIQNVDRLYFGKRYRAPVLSDSATQKVVWDRILGAFYFQNLSVDALAYVYENTLVTQPTRKLLGIHGTPASIAEYVVRHLPLEDVPEKDRYVFEPFAGCASFLIAATRRLRELLPRSLSPSERHQYFVEHLSGMEVDEFALEVAYLSLMLADYPNRDSWRLERADVFSDSLFDELLARAGIVLCNPPFENFTTTEQTKYMNLSSVHKPAVLLDKLLKKPPALLGLVLPRSFIDGHGYRSARRALAESYSSIELVTLPDKVFEHSHAETVLLMASGKGRRRLLLKTGSVYNDSLKSFEATHQLSISAEEEFDRRAGMFDERMWVSPLKEVWRELASLPKLGSVAEIHRGIEYNLPFAENKSILVSTEPQAGFQPGLQRVEDGLEPYVITRRVFLNMSSDVMYGKAYTLPWNMPKVIANASPRSTTGRWRLTAASDFEGLCCYQRLQVIWPRDNEYIDYVASILNGPVANAFVFDHEGKRDIRVETLKAIPIPHMTLDEAKIITALVKGYRDARARWLSGSLSVCQGSDACRKLLLEIDAEVLKAYNLPPKYERILLDFFAGSRRPVPFEFSRYYPESFKPYLPLHLFISPDFEKATAEATLKRLKPFRDSSVAKMLADLEDGH